MRQILAKAQSYYVDRADSFGRRVAPFEATLIISVLALCTLAVIYFSGTILETVPACEKGQSCPYQVPVFIGETLPALTWNWDSWRFEVIARPGDIEMQTVLQAGRSGSLADPMIASGFAAALIALWLAKERAAMG